MPPDISQIRAFTSVNLDTVDLNRNETAELYAARELFAHAVPGSVPFKGDKVLTFLREQPMPWWNGLRS